MAHNLLQRYYKLERTDLFLIIIPYSLFLIPYSLFLYSLLLHTCFLEYGAYCHNI